MVFEIRFKNILTNKKIIMINRGLTPTIAIEKAQNTFKIPSNYEVEALKIVNKSA